MATSQLTEIAEPTGFESCTISMSSPVGNTVYTVSLDNGEDISVALMRPSYFGSMLFGNNILGLFDNPQYLVIDPLLVNRIPVYSLSEYARSGKFVIIGCVVTTIGEYLREQVDIHFFRRVQDGDDEIIEYWYPEFYIDLSMISQLEDVWYSLP